MKSTMNTRMASVFTGLSVGFVGIVVMLSWWQIVVAGDLQQKDENNQTAYYEQRVERGFIETSDGVRLAGRVASKGANGDTIWNRRYPAGSLAAHVVGYDTRGHSRAGVERDLNDWLTGSTRDLGAVVGLLDGDEAAVGDDVRLTIDSRGQQAAEAAIAGKRGAIVAIQPRTGKVLAMASAPTFKPQDVLTDFDSVAGPGGDSRLFNRATQATYPPGSTFKLVTAAAALENGVPADRTFKGGCAKFETPGPDIANFGGECSPPNHDFTYALTHSVNTSFAELGAELGQGKLREQMERFGFFARPALEGLPGDEVRASGISADDGTPLPEDADFDEARTAIGQDRLTVTPLQMAMVTAAIANDGVLLKPTLVERITNPKGGVEQKAEKRVWKRAISPETARTLGRMMESVVNEGSGTRAKLQGLSVAGKTGTADTAAGNLTWFVAYAPADAPEVAVAVAVEGQAAGQTGGDVAAPMARSVIEALLGQQARGGEQ